MNVTKISAILIWLLAGAGFSQNFWETVYVRDTLSPVINIDFDAAGRIFASVKGSYNVYRSADRGRTWDSAATGAPFPIGALGVHKNSGYILVGSGSTPDANSGRIYRSTDHGLTWTLTTFTTAPGWVGVSRIIEANDGNLLSSGSWTGGVLRSVDSGKTWGGANPFPFPAYAGATYGLDVNPIIPNEVYAGTEVAGNAVWRSTDNGMNWVMATQSGLNQGNVVSFGFSQTGWIFVSTVHGPYKSNDKGESWTSITNVFGTLGSFRTADDGTMYVGGVDPLGTSSTYRSTDNGGSWNPIASGLPAGKGKLIKRMFISPDGYLYGVNNYGIFRSVLPVNGSTRITGPVLVPAVNDGLRYDAQTGIISFSLSARQPVVLNVFNLEGQLVNRLLNRELDRGNYSIGRQFTPASSGFYIINMQHGGQQSAVKSFVVK